MMGAVPERGCSELSQHGFIIHMRMRRIGHAEVNFKKRKGMSVSVYSSKYHQHFFLTVSEFTHIHITIH
jgi:hypothetical protein